METTPKRSAFQAHHRPYAYRAHLHCVPVYPVMEIAPSRRRLVVYRHHTIFFNSLIPDNHGAVMPRCGKVIARPPTQGAAPVGRSALGHGLLAFQAALVHE